MYETKFLQYVKHKGSMYVTVMVTLTWPVSDFLSITAHTQLELIIYHETS